MGSLSLHIGNDLHEHSGWEWKVSRETAGKDSNTASLCLVGSGPVESHPPDQPCFRGHSAQSHTQLNPCSQGTTGLLSPQRDPEATALQSPISASNTLRQSSLAELALGILSRAGGGGR